MSRWLRSTGWVTRLAASLRLRTLREAWPGAETVAAAAGGRLMGTEKTRVRGQRLEDSCSRCGVDLSRGYVASRSPPGGVVCMCCDWLDDVERQQWSLSDPYA